MVEEKLEIKGTEYQKGEPLVIQHKFISTYKPYDDKLVEVIGYLRRVEERNNMRFIYLSSQNPDLTDKLSIWDFSKYDFWLREDWITDISRVLLEKK